MIGGFLVFLVASFAIAVRRSATGALRAGGVLWGRARLSLQHDDAVFARLDRAVAAAAGGGGLVFADLALDHRSVRWRGVCCRICSRRRFRGSSAGSVDAYRWTLVAGTAIAASVSCRCCGWARPGGGGDRPPAALSRENRNAWPSGGRCARTWRCSSLVGGLMSLGVGMVIPFYNVYLITLGASAREVGLIFALGGAVAAVIGLTAPTVGRRFGALYAVLLVRCSIVPFYLALIFFPSYALAIMAHLVRQTSISMSWPIDSTFIGDLLPPRSRANVFGLRSAAWNLGFSLAAFVGGKIIVRNGYDWTFASIAVFTSAFGAALRRLLHRRHPLVRSGALPSALPVGRAKRRAAGGAGRCGGPSRDASDLTARVGSATGRHDADSLPPVITMPGCAAARRRPRATRPLVRSPSSLAGHRRSRARLVRRRRRRLRPAPRRRWSTIVLADLSMRERVAQLFIFHAAGTGMTDGVRAESRTTFRPGGIIFSQTEHRGARGDPALRDADPSHEPGAAAADRGRPGGRGGRSPAGRSRAWRARAWDGWRIAEARAKAKQRARFLDELRVRRQLRPGRGRRLSSPRARWRRAVSAATRARSRARSRRWFAAPRTGACSPPPSTFRGTVARRSIPISRCPRSTSPGRHGDRADGRPFRSAVDAGVDMVMVGHLRYSNWDDAPMSLSKVAVRALRKDLGFEGVIVTDDLGMGALAGIDPIRGPRPGDRRRRRPLPPPGDRRATGPTGRPPVAARDRKDKVSEKRIDASVRRIVALKIRRFDLHPQERALSERRVARMRRRRPSALAFALVRVAAASAAVRPTTTKATSRRRRRRRRPCAAPAPELTPFTPVVRRPRPRSALTDANGQIDQRRCLPGRSSRTAGSTTAPGAARPPAAIGLPCSAIILRSDDDWVRAGDLVATPTARRAGAAVERTMDTVRVTFPDGTGFRVPRALRRPLLRLHREQHAAARSPRRSGRSGTRSWRRWDRLPKP